MEFRYTEIEENIIKSVKSGVENKEIGVAFSGGLDSSLVSAIAAEYAKSVTLYTCGTENSFDVIMAKDMCQKLELEWIHVPISKRIIEMRVRDLITSTGISDPFTISYEMPLFCVCMTANEEYILSGQGADEIFMGCAKFVGQTDNDYFALKQSSMERLLDISMPCEKAIAAHFNKTIIYPYMEQHVISTVSNLKKEELRPKDMNSRKLVLKEIARHLGYNTIADRKKKSSQYGSGTTDLIRTTAREKGMMFNEYIRSIYEDVFCRTGKDVAPVNAYIDPQIKVKAEKILTNKGISPSQAIERLYRTIIDEDSNYS